MVKSLLTRESMLFGLKIELISIALLFLPMLFSRWGPCGPSNGYLFIPVIIGLILNFSFVICAPLLNADLPEMLIFVLGLACFVFQFLIWSALWGFVLHLRSSYKGSNKRVQPTGAEDRASG
jgi:hypothetical protein